MPAPAVPSPRSPRRPFPRRRGIAAALATAALAAAAVPAGIGSAATPPSDRSDAAQSPRAARAASPVMLTQANILTDLSVRRFQADVRTVLAPRPDFVTYNEVPFRGDEVLAPEGYELHRSPANRYTAATAVAWRTDRWTAVDTGTFRLTNWRGRPPGRVTELGRRFANWATLQDAEGRTVSVVAVHFAPPVRGMPDLVRPSARRLGTLVDRLAPAGPVLVGGDLNVHYRSGRYPGDVFAAHQLTPTFDSLRSFFATGDHQGATIDYVLSRGSDVLGAQQQYATELNSDHDALTAGFDWLTEAPSATATTLVSSDPAGSESDRRAALASLIAGVRGAQPGSVVRVVTSRLDVYALAQELRRAVARGVHVQFIKVGTRGTVRERLLKRMIARHGDPKVSWSRSCTTDRCLRPWRTTRSVRGQVNGLMQVRDARAGHETRWDTHRQFAQSLLTEASTVRVSTDAEQLGEGRRLFRVLQRRAR